RRARRAAGRRSPLRDRRRGVAACRYRARLALVRALLTGGRARRRVAVPRHGDYSGRQSVAISRPEPRRRLKLPRNLPGSRQPQPYSRADAPYFRSPGFYVRIGGLAIVVAAGVSLLLLRAWSIQVLHGRQYAKAAHTQAFRTVDLLGARGAIIDSKGRLIAGTTGHPVIEADAASLGRRDAHGHWHPSPAGVRALQRLGKTTRRRWGILAARIRKSVLQSPFAPAVVIAHPDAAFTSYMQERSGQFPWFKLVVADDRSYPQGAYGSEFIGLLGQINPEELKSGAYKRAK